MNHYVPVDVFHPGEYLQDELTERGWTQEDFAEITGISRRQIINLIKGKSGITIESATAIANAFGQEPLTWMNLQISYELAMTAKHNRGIEKKAKIYSKVPLREIVKRSWISDRKSVDELEAEVCRFLRIKSIDDQCQMSVAARKSSSYESHNPAQIAWYCRVRELAESAPCAKVYQESRFEELISKLSALTAYPEDIANVPTVLSDFGIRLVLVEHLRTTLIDGVAHWINDFSPVIGMSLRQGRIDNFWYTLMHELVHIKYRDEEHVDSDINHTPEDEETVDIERRANSEAADYLVPKQKMDSFIQRHYPLFYTTKIVQFAQARKVHPGIVVGQLQHRKLVDWKCHRKQLPSIRDQIIGKTITDGWGFSPKAPH